MHRLKLPCCIISSFYIKPQQKANEQNYDFRCIISSFYIKPQHWICSGSSYIVVLYLHSTSNHNKIEAETNVLGLYYIFILHQTTTFLQVANWLAVLYYIFILHQTTTTAHSIFSLRSCIISSFYIKPQLGRGTERTDKGCIISSFYIKPQRTFHKRRPTNGCIISSFYIKPQRRLFVQYWR